MVASTEVNRRETRGERVDIAGKCQKQTATQTQGGYWKRSPFKGKKTEADSERKEQWC